MTKLSKSFYLGSVLIGFILMIGFLIGEFIELADNRPENALIFVGLIWMILIYIVIIFSVLVYKMWAAIQDGHARATPGKALGFCFIPFFNLYWVFQAFPGFAKDYNKLVDRYSLNISKLPESLFMTYAVLCILAVIPLLGLLAVLVNLVIMIFMISKICDGVNALPNISELPEVEGVYKEGPQEKTVSRKKGVVFAIVAAVFYLVFVKVGIVVLFRLAQLDDFFPHVEIGQFGPFLFLILGITILAILASSVLLLFEGLGKRIAVAVLMGCSVLPWLSGMWGFEVGMRNLNDAIEQIGISHNFGLFAAAHAESTLPLLLGVLLSGLMLAAAGFGLSLCAVGRGVKTRWAPGLALGFGSGVPLVVFVAIMVTTGKVGWLLGSMLLIVALGVAVVAGLAGAGAGQDPPYGRSACLAAAAPVAMGLSFYAMATSAYLWKMVKWFDVVAIMGPDFAKQIVQGTFSTMEAFSMLRWVGGLLVLLPILGLAVWSYYRSRPYPPRILAAVILGIVVVLTVGLEYITEGQNKQMLTTIAQETAKLHEKIEPPKNLPEPTAMEKGSEPIEIIQMVPPPPKDTKNAGSLSEAPSPKSVQSIPPPPLIAIDGEVGGVSGGVIGGVPPGLLTSAPLQVGGDVKAPKLIARTQPEYTEMARRARIQGVVVLNMIVDAKGNVTNIKVLRGLPLGLSESAVKAVRDWKFESATLHGKPVSVYFTLSVRFQFQ